MHVYVHECESECMYIECCVNEYIYIDMYMSVGVSACIIDMYNIHECGGRECM